MSFEVEVASLVVKELMPVMLQKFDELKNEWRRSTEGERPTDRMTLEDVAKKLKVSKRTVLRMTQDGRLPAPEGTGVSRRWMVRDVHMAKEARIRNA